MTKIYDCIVIGAGISGLIAAQQLKSQNKEVIIIEKSRGVGGRMATRRVGNATFDHGAQFFTTRSDEFISLIKRATDDGFVHKWCHGFLFPEGENIKIRDDGYPRFCGKKGMTSLPKMLAQNLDILFKKKINTAHFSQHWHIQTEDSVSYCSNQLLITAPIPQALDILNSVSHPKLDEIRNIKYKPCFALMVTTNMPSSIPYPGGIKNWSSNVDWIGDNQKKGISEVPALTIHASASFTQQNFDLEPEKATEILLKDVAKWINGDVITTKLHRWRYCAPKTVYPDRCLYLHTPPVCICGDAFAGPKIEGAFLSGLAAAVKLSTI